MGTTGYEIFPATSLGTGVTETELGTGITTPSQAKQIVSFIPWNSATGAYTAAQASVAEMAIRSDSIPLTPKRVFAHGGSGGIGAFVDVLIPILNEFDFHTPIGDQAVLHCFGTQQTLNTVAFDGGGSIRYDTDPLPPNYRGEKFWIKPNDETTTGTAIGRTTGGTMQISTGTPNGGALTDLWGFIYTSGTLVVSESIHGSLGFTSDSFNDAMPLRPPLQPIGGGLTTAPGLLTSKNTIWPCFKPMKTSTLITTELQLDEALTNALSWIAGVGYVKL